MFHWHITEQTFYFLIIKRISVPLGLPIYSLLLAVHIIVIYNGENKKMLLKINFELQQCADLSAGISL